MADYAFRTVTGNDLSMLTGWLTQLQVSRWWPDAGSQISEIRARLGDPAITQLIVTHADTPIAFVQHYPARRHLATPERMADLLDRGHALLQIMEDRLSGHDWLVGEGVTLADICLYGYTHTAGTRGGFDMARFPGINAWTQRISALPGYKGLNG